MIEMKLEDFRRKKTLKILSVLIEFECIKPRQEIDKFSKD